MPSDKELKRNEGANVWFPLFFPVCYTEKPIPVAAPSKPWVCGRSPAGIVGLKPAVRMKVCLL